jgi:hypothetical protein
MSRWGVVLEYVRDLLGLGWCHSPLVLGLIRDKGRLLREVSLACKSSKPLYKERRCINLIKQEIRRKSFPSCPAVGKAPGRPPPALAALAAATTST